MRQIERDIQREIMLRLRFAPLDALIIPVPNGIWLPARNEAERSLIARLIARLKADGFLLPGAADLLVLARDFSGAIELKRPAASTLLGKTPKGRLSEAQRGFKQSCEALGIAYALCSSWADVRDRLIAWGRLPSSWIDAEHRTGRAA